PPFDGRDRQELLRQIAFEEPKAPRRLNRAVPADVETVVLKALAKSPAERYATAQDLADDLRRWLEDRPIQARPPTLWQQGKKWTRRHRAVVTTAVAGLLAALLVLAGSIGWVLHDRAVRRQQTADQVDRALQEAETLLKQKKRAEARAAVQKARE